MSKKIFRIALGVVAGIALIIVVSCILFRGEKKDQNLLKARLAAEKTESFAGRMSLLFYRVFDKQEYLRRKNEIEEKEWRSKVSREEYSRLEELEETKKRFDAFLLKADGLDKKMCIAFSRDEIRGANNRYAMTMNNVEAYRKNPANYMKTCVSDSIDSFNAVRVSIQNRIERVKNARKYLSAAQRIEENTKRLSWVLNGYGTGYEIALTSAGINRNKSGDPRILIFNGLLRYRSMEYLQEAESLFKELGFSEKRTSRNVFNILVLTMKDGKYNSKNYYAPLSDFNERKISVDCGGNFDYGTRWGVYAGIQINGTNYLFSCSRLHVQYIPRKWCRIVMYLCDQPTVRWNMSVSLSDFDARRYSDKGGEIYVNHPVWVRAIPLKGFAYGHRPIEQPVEKSVYRSASLSNSDAVDQPIPPFRESFLTPNAYMLGNTPGVDESTARKNWNAAKKGDIEAQFKTGRDFEDGMNYPEAYRWYQKAAKKGHFMSALNCGILLCQEKVPIFSSSTKEKISFAVAEKFLMNALKSEKPEIRGAAANCLGFLYEKGGSGLVRNREKALRFYKMAKEAGNSFGQKNFERLRN